MAELKPRGKKTNHKKGIAKAKKEQKKQEALARNEKYQKLNLNEKITRNSVRVKRKLGAIEHTGE